MTDLERVERATEQCREVVRQAHEAMKDLRAALAEQRDWIRAHVQERVEAEMQAHVERQLKALGDQTQQAMAASVAKVNAEFDKLAGILLGTDDGGPTMEELIRRYRQRQSSGEVLR